VSFTTGGGDEDDVGPVAASAELLQRFAGGAAAAAAAATSVCSGRFFATAGTGGIVDLRPSMTAASTAGEGRSHTAQASTARSFRSVQSAQIHASAIVGCLNNRAWWSCGEVGAQVSVTLTLVFVRSHHANATSLLPFSMAAETPVGINYTERVQACIKRVEDDRSVDRMYSAVMTICKLLDDDSVTDAVELASLATHFSTIWMSELSVSCGEGLRMTWSGSRPPSLRVGASPAVLWWCIRNRHHQEALRLLDEQVPMVAVVRQLIEVLPRAQRGEACPLVFVHFRCVFSVECMETIVARREILSYLPKLLSTGHFEAYVAASAVVTLWRTDTQPRLLKCLQQWLEQCQEKGAERSAHLPLLHAALTTFDRNVRYDSATVMQPWKDLRSELIRLQASSPRPVVSAVGIQHIKRDWKISVAQAAAASSGGSSSAGLPPLSPSSPTLSPISPLALTRQRSA
jgi:hypothetical protein